MFWLGLAIGAAAVGIAWWLHARTYVGAKSDLLDAKARLDNAKDTIATLTNKLKGNA